MPYADKKLFETNPWSRRADEDVLRCARLPMKGEPFLCEREFGDGVFHVEWRFAPVGTNGKGYNSGVFVRNSPDGVIWHQAQVGNGNVGYLFGSTLKDGKVQSFKVDDKVPQRGKPPGEWNTYELTCRGKNVTLWINGAVTAMWDRLRGAARAGRVGSGGLGHRVPQREVQGNEVRPGWSGN